MKNQGLEECTFAKLCAEILAAVSDGMLNIEDATEQSVLRY
ncbi:hypothetical protein MtrunA17_Chr7g0270731 [Medicago truncatula]|uniref:Uncharacterized protein n=1 Tax=Medicago truncatula TaxID=3880 RepID=A0A396H760_MEDTR|nr:hypothetical protein MtrunA17_Chr7g0270731 [Medicago truncatula]